MATPVSSSTASTGSDPQPLPDTDSSSAVITTVVHTERVRTQTVHSSTTGTRSIPPSSSLSSPSLSPAISTENSTSTSPVAQRLTSESLTGQNETDGGPSGAHVSTPHEPPSYLSSSDAAESSSVLDQSASFVTQRSEVTSLPTLLTTEGTYRENEVSSPEYSTTDSGSTVTDTTVISQENSADTSARTEQPSSLSPPVWTSHTSQTSSEIEADATSEEMVTTAERTQGGPTPSLRTQESDTPSFQPAVSDSFKASIASDIFRSPQPTDGSVSVDPSLSSSWQVDFSASWPDGIERESLDDDTSFFVTSTLSFSSEFLPQTTQYSIDVSLSSQDDASRFVSSSTLVLEPSSVARFVSSTRESVEESRAHSSAHVSATPDSAGWVSTQPVFSVSLSPLPSSTLSSSSHQTQNVLEPSHAVFTPSHTETTGSIPASPSTVLSSSVMATEKGLLETVLVSASSTVPSVTATAEITLPSSSTPVTEMTSAPTPTTLTTNRTTATTTVKSTQPAKRDVRYMFTLTGDCRLILNNTEFFQRFLAGFHDLIVKQLGIAEDTYRLGEISCGSVHVYVTFFHVTMPEFDIMLQSIIRNGGPGLSVPVWIDSHFATFDLVHAKHVPLAPDEHTYNIVTQVMDDVDIIVIIVACCVCGVLIAIGVAICVKECYRRKHATSFNLLDVPHVNLKLEDFTLTKIPRPRTIYKEPSCAKSAFSGDGGEVTNGHAKSASNGKLHPADMRLRIKEHSDGIIVGITASVGAPNSINHRPQQSSADQVENFTNGTIKRNRSKMRTPSGEDMAEGECQASQRLLAGHQGETDGTPNPVFVDDPDDEGHNDERCGGAL